MLTLPVCIHPARFIQTSTTINTIIDDYRDHHRRHCHPPSSYLHFDYQLLYSNKTNIQATGPAYTPVTVRQGFGQTYPPQSQYSYAAPANPPQPPPTTTPEQQQKIDWPDAVRQYVQRSFEDANKDPSVTRVEMEAKLKEVIRYTQEIGTMYTTDWHNLPLPQQMVRAERQQKLMASMAPPPPQQSSRPTMSAENRALQASLSSMSFTSPEQQSIATFPATAHSKKRKSSDLSSTEQTSSAAAPWRSTKGGSLGDRITHPSNDKRPTMDGPLPAKSKFQKNAEKRQRRGDGGYQSSYRSPSPPPPSGPIVGYCTNWEKPYFRLTSAPKPSEVRPEHVLHKTLDHLKTKWRKESNYNYICEQFKSLRQDLTVQRIRNEFTVSVYEIHARIALEKGDLGEYNQCQTQLRALYASGIKGNSIEFKAYRILYFIYTANRTALNDAIADLTTAEKEERPIQHALNVRSSLALGNYHKFFQLYLDVPNMGAYLMDMFVKRERLAALATMCKAYVLLLYPV